MSEVAEQLILEYLGRVADAAHGELSSRERLDFCDRLRRRIEEHRAGSDDPRRVRQVLARFGDPKFLVARERRRLDEARAKTSAAASGDGQVRDVEKADEERGEDAERPRRSAQRSARRPRSGKPRAPVRTVRGGGRTTRRFTWSPSGAVRLRRERRGGVRDRLGPLTRLVAAVRGGLRSSFRRRRTTD
ncbi:hypothetical protein [Spirillospora sp. NPDC047279]|uniref:hypothetical protein n=1 Tax=Spirillospora sp. NPDC047279 TaxID=3155478 RepID=UPI0033D44E13